jgi:hypothetical protein
MTNTMHTRQQEERLLQGIHREDSVIAVFDTLDQTERAIHLLDQDGFPLRQISVVSSAFHSEREVQGYITAGDVAISGAGNGAWAGGIFGLLMGSGFLWLPVFGPMFVVGSLASMLIGGAGGAAIGAAAGSALGALMGLGVSGQHLLKYEEKVRTGRFLLIAHGHASEVECARVALERSGVRELTVHSEAFV